MRLLPCLLLLLVLASCRQTQKDRYDPYAPYQEPYSGVDIAPGQIIAQGMLGANMLTDATRSGGSTPPVSQSSDVDTLPMIAGAFQWPLWGERVDAGFEAGGSLAFQTGGGFVAAGGNGLIVAVDVDMVIFDLFGGPFISTSLGDKVRLWGGAGPLLQFVDYDQDYEGSAQGGSGFGTGLYVRAGVDVMVSRSMLVGIGARWVDSRTSLGSGLGTLDMQGTQVFATFTSGF